MGVITESHTIMSCDGPNCQKTVTFDKGNAAQMQKENPWMLTARVVQLAKNNQTFVYCTSLCELNAVEKGKHDPVDFLEKKISEDTNIQQAVAEQKASASVTDAIKSGRPITIK